MGREIRRVPPNWEHPRQDTGQYQPVRDKSYAEAAEEWIREFYLWQEGKHPSQSHEWAKEYKYYWEYEGTPPEKDYYLSEFTEEPTWYQVYETVSEGTPVSPPFATKEELIDYLVEYGDFWDQKRGHGGRSREAATAFVNSGWVPSMVVADGKIFAGIDSSILQRVD